MVHGAELGNVNRETVELRERKRGARGSSCSICGG